ncbi:MAG: hypothetical protein CME86_17475 [Herbaspirillum sp.]|nr:hypothetical protein [Herbaspirillum sp.]MBO14208.1 hypothetical protein [Herbaspirillum sp.]
MQTVFLMTFYKRRFIGATEEQIRLRPVGSGAFQRFSTLVGKRQTSTNQASQLYSFILQRAYPFTSQGRCRIPIAIDLIVARDFFPTRAINHSSASAGHNQKQF